VPLGPGKQESFPQPYAEAGPEVMALAMRLGRTALKGSQLSLRQIAMNRPRRDTS
jgi:hypothetical protein